MVQKCSTGSNSPFLSPLCSVVTRAWGIYCCTPRWFEHREDEACAEVYMHPATLQELVKGFRVTLMLIYSWFLQGDTSFFVSREFSVEVLL